MPLEEGWTVWAHAVRKQADFEVELAYLTEIQTARDGTELRRAWRDRPRKQFRFPVRADGRCYRALTRDIAARQRGPWGVADASRRVLSATGMAAAASEIGVFAIETWMAAGETVILTDAGRIEARTIDSLAGSPPSGLTFTEANGAVAWPAGTQIAPAVSCRLDPRASGRRRRFEGIDFAAVFDATPGYELYEEPAPAATLFKTRELFTLAPRRVEPVEATYLSGLEIVDVEIGRKAFNEPVTFPSELDRFHYGPVDADCAQRIEDLFIRARGGRGSFYAPSFAADLAPVGTAMAGAATLTVEGAGVANDFFESTVFKNIAIQYANNDWQALEVTAMALDGDNSVLSLDGTLDGAVSAGTVRRISWLFRRRFAGDALSVAWREGRARVSLALMTLEDE